jgi:hypothetical protein
MQRDGQELSRSGLCMKVADIVFDFDNGKLIKALKKRGKAINKQDPKKIQKADDEVNKWLTKSGYFEKFTRPNKCIITFEDEMGVEEAQFFTKTKNIWGRKIIKKDQPQMCGQNLEFKRTTPPSNIKWAN